MFPEFVGKGPPQSLDYVPNEAFITADRKIGEGDPMSDDEVTNFIARCFRIDFLNNKKLDHSKSDVGPPYNIYEIRTNGVFEILSRIESAGIVCITSSIK